MKKILTFVAICVSLFLNSQNKSEMSKAIDLASIQRVLVQQMAKDKLFIEVNNKTSVAEKELEQAIISFEKNLETLKNLAPNKKIKHEIQEEEFAYRYYKHLILPRLPPPPPFDEHILSNPPALHHLSWQ